MSFSNKAEAAAIFFITFLFFSGCATLRDFNKDSLIAVLPVENLSGASAPLKEIRQSLIWNLKKKNVKLMDEKSLDMFMTWHRMRYTGGIDKATAKAFREETGTSAVLITCLEYYSEQQPPKISLTSRLVSTDDFPKILWLDSVGMAGDDSPGMFQLGMIEDPQRLMRRAIRRLSSSLNEFILKKWRSSPGERTVSAERSNYDLSEIVKIKIERFEPKYFYRSPAINPSKKYSVVVIPFFNESDRKDAGDIMALQFVNILAKNRNLSVVEPGVVRQELLKWRFIMDDGISLAQADIIFESLNVDLIVTGKVMDYQDYKGTFGIPKVDFSSMVMERESRKIVWASKSQNKGDDYVSFFDLGKIKTAHTIANKMVNNTVNMMFK